MPPLSSVHSIICIFIGSTTSRERRKSISWQSFRGSDKNFRDAMLHHASFMMTRWTVLEKAVKNMSTISPTLLLKEDSEENRRTFLDLLRRRLLEHDRDYVEYVLPTFPGRVDTELAVCVKYSHRVAGLALRRFVDATRLLPRPESRTKSDVHSYFSRLSVPSGAMYHSECGPSCAADLLHRLYALAAVRHLFDYDDDDDDDRDGNDDNDTTTGPLWSTGRLSADAAPLLWTNREANRLLEYAALLDSYPVVPENLDGVSVATLQISERRNFDVLAPGADSRMRVHRFKDPRVCVSCRLTNLQMGLTDAEEQDAKLPCRCLFEKKTSPASSSSYDSSYVCRGIALARILLFNKTVVPREFGCSCSEHADVFTNRVARLKKTLDSTGIIR